MKETEQPTNKPDPEANKKLSRREAFTAIVFGGAAGYLTISLYLRSSAGRELIYVSMEGGEDQNPQIEIDTESSRLINLYNETIKSSFEYLSPIEQSAARELEKRKNVVFQAAEEGLFKFRLGMNEEGHDDSYTIPYYSYDNNDLIVQTRLPNIQSTDTEMIQALSHEIGHAYQIVAEVIENGFNDQKNDELNESRESGDTEVDAWIFDDIATYLYTKTHPDDKDYGLLLDPKAVGIDQIGFTEFWLSRLQEFPQTLTNDLEYKWFVERYNALLDVGIEHQLGKDRMPPLIPLTVRDSDISQEFIDEASKFYVACSWSEEIGLEMDPSENNPFISRHFIQVEQFHS